MKKLIQGFLYWASGRPAFACNDSAAGSRPDGKATFYPGAAIASEGLFCTLSAGLLIKATENGIAIGQNLAIAYTADISVTPIACDLLSSGGEKSVTADAAITALDDIVVGASGGAKTLPTSNGTYYVVGTALVDAAAGATLRYMPCVPRKVVIST